MAITLTLPPDVERVFLAEAATRGMSLNDLISGMLVSQAHPHAPSAHVVSQSVSIAREDGIPDLCIGYPTNPSVLNDMSPANPEEWVQEFRAWAEGHERNNLPLLSDEAISREFIYSERGL